MLQMGPWELRSVVTGTFRLDGGAMFGVVPKVLWRGVAEPDEQNRIPLTTRTLLAVNRAAGRIFVVDTGCGSKWTPEMAGRFAIRHDSNAVTNALADAGFSANDVTDVVVTHLHFDHNGGLTEWVDEPGGAIRLCFPRANHWIHRQQWQHSHAPHYKDRASYLKVDFESAELATLLRFVEGGSPASPFEGVEWFISHGHTPFQLHPVFGFEKNRILFVGDVIPTSAHLRPSWVMAYDVEPLKTIAEKETILRLAIDGGCFLAFPHDPTMGVAQITGTPDKPNVIRSLLD